MIFFAIFLSVLVDIANLRFVSDDLKGKQVTHKVVSSTEHRTGTGAATD